jgi:hypothetical protein
MNLYGYVNNDPVNATDASGMCSSCPADELIDYQSVAAQNQQSGNKFATEAWQWLKENHPIGAPARGYDAVVQQDWESALWSLGTAGLGAIADRVGHGVALIRDALRQTCCFVAGTLVSTRDGLRPIEDIKVGDFVLARNEKTGETGLKPVTDLVRRHDREIWKLTLATSVGGDGKGTLETFETTDDHPWRTAAGTWVQTMDLKTGMAVLRARGPPITVLSVERTGIVQTTFNLEVADWHTYFVGDSEVWVHNAFCGVHGNDLRSKVTQHMYSIEDTQNGSIFKVGVSGQPLSVAGGSPRATAQVNKLNRASGAPNRYKANIIATDIPNRAMAVEVEEVIIRDARAKGHVLPGNIRPR